MISFITLIVSTLTVATVIDSSTLKLTEEAVYVTNKYYKHRFVTSVVCTADNSEEVNEFLIKYPGSVVVTRLSNETHNDDIIFYTKHNAGYEQTVFFVTNLYDFKTFMTFISQRLRFPIRLILIYTKVINDVMELSDFNKIAWRNNLADFVVISRKVNDRIIFSTYFPYEEGICGNYNPVVLGYDENLFPKKFTNFNKCPLRITAIPFQSYVHIVYENGSISELDGYDGRMLTQIKEAVNATFQFIDVPDNNGLGTLANGKVSGAMYNLVYNKSDIIIPAGILSQGRYSITQMSHVYHDLDMRWTGPQRREIYHYIKVLIPFFNIITPLLCLALLLFVIVVILISRVSYGRYKSENICFQAFTLLVGQTVEYVTTVPLLNNLFMLWIWFSFIVRTVYQGYLVDSLQTPVLEPPFITIEEAVHRVDGYGSTQILLEYYKNTSLEKNFQIFPLSEFYNYVDHVAKGKRFLVAADKFLFRRVRNSVQILAKQITSSWSCFYMRPGWAAAPTINSIFLHIIESGFMEKLLRMDSRVRTDIKDNSVRPLDMTIFSACFYIMAFLWVMSSLACLMEIIYNKHITTNKRNKNIVE